MKLNTISMVCMVLCSGVLLFATMCAMSMEDFYGEPATENTNPTAGLVINVNVGDTTNNQQPTPTQANTTTNTAQSQATTSQAVTNTTYQNTFNEYDFQPPQLNVTEPYNGQWITDSVTVKGTSMDNVALSKIQLQLDDGAWVDATGTDTWEYTFSGLNSGYHFIVVRGTDTSNNTETKGVFVHVDSTPPEFTITYPEDNSHFGDTVSIGGTSTDNDQSGVDKIEVRINSDGVWSEVTGSMLNWEYVWNASGEPIGSYKVYVRATDKVGNVSTVDDAIPDITIAKTEWNQLGSAYNIDIGESAKHSHVAMYNNTAYVAASEFDGTNWQIRVRKWNGTDWSTIGDSLNALANQNAYWPRIAVTNDGTIYVAWHEYDGSRYRIQTARWDATGGVWQSLGIINRSESCDATYPSISVKGGNLVYVAWEEYYDGTKVRNVYVKYYDGSIWNWANGDHRYGVCNWGCGYWDNPKNYTPDIYCYDDACYLIYRAEWGTHRAYVLKNTGGTGWSGVGGAAIPDSGNPPYYPSIAVLDHDNVFVAGQQSDGTYYQLVTYQWTPGGGWVSLGSANENASQNAHRPSLEFRRTSPQDPTPYLAYSEEVGGTTETIYFKKYNSGSGAWETITSEILNPVTGFSCHIPRLTFDGSNPYVAFYEDNGVDNQKAYIKYYYLP